MRRFFAPAFLLIATGCASAPPPLLTQTPDHVIAVARANARINEQTFASQDPNAIRAAIAGACARGCTALEIRPTPAAPYRAIRAVYDAAVANGAARLQLRGASALVPLVTGPQAVPETTCANEMVLRRDGIDVYIDGRVLEPDPECAPWGATVCAETTADPTADFEWASLRRVAAEHAATLAGPLCVYARDDVGGRTLDLAVSSVAAETHNRTLFALRTHKAPGRLADERITAVVMDHAKTFTACYDRELEESTAPMALTMSILIQTDGSVAGAKPIAATGTTPRFEACLVAAVEAMKFPAPDGGAAILINYPLSFTARG